MSIVNGSDLYMWMDGELIAYSTSYTLNVNMETRPGTNKGSGLWKKVLPGMFDASGSCDGLYVFESSAARIMNAMLARNPVTLQFGIKETGTSDLDTETEHFSGDFYITSFELNATDAENATYSASFVFYDNFGVTSESYWWVAPDGNDSTGTGEYNNPWLTLGYAVTQVTTPGETIHMKAGTYIIPSQVSVPLGVSIVGQGDTTILTTVSALEPMMTISSSAGNAVNGNQSISYLKFDGDLTGRRAIYANFRSNVKIHHCTIVDFLYSGITFDGTVENYNVTPSNTIPTGNEVHHCVFINNTQFTDNSSSGHIRPEGQRGLLIYNNTFDQTDRAAGDNADIIAGYQNYGLQIYDNILTKNDSEAAGWNFFLELHHSHGGMNIYDNIFNGAATCDISGVVSGTYSYGARINDNYFHVVAPVAVDPNYSPAITLESFDELNDVFVYNNYFENVRAGVYLDNVYTSAENIWIYYNIFDNVGHTSNNFSFGILIKSYWEATEAATPFDDIYILNNVIDCGTEGHDGIGAYLKGTVTNLNIQNNIINGNYEDYAIDFKLGGSAAAATVNTLNINNNIFYGGVNNSFHSAAAITITDDDTTGNIVDDPLFNDPSNGDFRLQAASPAIDAGVDVSLTTDFDGRTVGDPPEIGAYEYV